jgi:hypothetical protein
LIIDILIKTYPQDYDWLPGLWKSLARVRGYRSVVLLLEEQYPAPPNLPANVVVARSRQYVGTDYPSDLGAVVERLRAWAYTDADRILYVDSDCVFSRDVDLHTEPTINAERPIVLWRPWEEAGGAAFLRAPAARTLGYDPPRETMCRYPFCFPRDVLKACWDFIGGENRLLTLTTKEERDANTVRPRSYLMPPTDWNVLGNFALDHAPEAVTAVNWRDAAPACVKQFWSWHRPTHPAVQDELRRMGLAD